MKIKFFNSHIIIGDLLGFSDRGQYGISIKLGSFFVWMFYERKKQVEQQLNSTEEARKNRGETEVKRDEKGATRKDKDEVLKILKKIK